MRAAAREKIFEPASLSTGAESTRVHMLDVSIGGAKLHCPAPLAIGASVVLAWADEERVAHVAWIAGARCGLRLRIPLAADQIETLTRPALPRHRPAATIGRIVRQVAADHPAERDRRSRDPRRAPLTTGHAPPRVA